MAAPAAYVQFSGRFNAWWIDGLSLVVGATGLALFWTGLTGVSPDWVDDGTPKSEALKSKSKFQTSDFRLQTSDFTRIPIADCLTSFSDGAASAGGRADL